MYYKYRLKIILFVAFTFSFYDGKSQDAIIYPSLDTYIQSSQANVSFNGEDELLLKHTLSETNDRSVWLKFPTSTIEASSEQVLLRLVQNSGDNANISIVGVNNTFDQNLTWATASNNYNSIAFGGMRLEDTSLIDVTDYVVNNLGNEIGLKIFTTSLINSTIKFSSSENDLESLRPQLLVYNQKKFEIPVYNNFETTTVPTENGTFIGELLANHDILEERSQYGGWSKYTSTPTGFFRTEQDCNGAWHIVDPDGFGFYSVGLNTVTEGGGVNLPDDIKAYSFNTMGSWSDESIDNFAYTPRFNVLVKFKNTDDAIKTIYETDILPVFEPNFKAFCENLAQTELQQYLNDPWVLGYFIDNELPFHKLQLSLSLTHLNSDNAQYIAANEWMINKYGDDYNLSDISDEDEQLYQGYVADTYFKTVSEAFKAVDPNHLLIGTRIHAAGKFLPELFEAAGPYLDIVSINFYNRIAPLQEYTDMWMEEGKKPFMITEFYTKAEDTGQDNIDGAGWLVPTQKDRANWFENFTLTLLRSKGSVGYHWFRYVDKESDMSNKGAFNVNYEPYTTLLNSMDKIGKSIYSLRSHVLYGNANYNGCIEASFDIEEETTYLDLRVFLESCYVSNEIMGNSLENLIPSTEPYTSLGYVFLGGGSEFIEDDVLAQTGADKVMDWVIVELRDPTDMTTVLASRAGLLLADGDVVDIDGETSIGFELTEEEAYIVVKHRNHLGVMSRDPIDLTQSSATIDFSDIGNIYSDATLSNAPAKEMENGVYALYQGDANGDGQINSSDASSVFGKAVPLVSHTYSVDDVNMDGDISTSDASEAFENAVPIIKSHVKQ